MESNQAKPPGSRWCIVVADDHGPEWASRLDPVPVQYCRLDEAVTPLQQSLHRASTIAPASQVILTAFEEYRDLWQPSSWFLRPERRFVCDRRAVSQLSLAAAILSVAALSPSHVITILPARCHVANEWVLRRSMTHALLELPHIPEGVVALGMLDIEEGVDEDYLIPGRPLVGGGLRVDSCMRRPVWWIARHLRQQGALVASGMMIGYAGVLAAHITKHWPGFCESLANAASSAAAAGRECEITSSLVRRVPCSILQSLRWHAPHLPQRVFGVYRSGWSGLKTPRSVARMIHFLSRRAELDIVGRTGAANRAKDVPALTYSD